MSEFIDALPDEVVTVFLAATPFNNCPPLMHVWGDCELYPLAAG